MTNLNLLYLILALVSMNVFAQKETKDAFPVRGFCIAAPRPALLPEFVKFIEEELGPRGVNTLILRVDFNYQFERHPELRDSAALSKSDVKKLVNACRANGMQIIPQINLLGHQSWANRTGNLLRVYPDFDETPWVEMPVQYAWPNADGLYCKSYCPLHPDVHKIVFSLVDEVCDAFESQGFHAGMDEVFYIAEEKCPRCSGHDAAALFAGEVRKIRDHLALKNRRLWIWGDRLLDGRETGLGMWEASMNNTHRSIDMIPTDVIICDWHYERPDKTAVYFAMKGFEVVTCPWRKPAVAAGQWADMVNFRKTATPVMRDRFQGIVQTVWSDPKTFMEGLYADKKDENNGTDTPWHSFTTLFPKQKPSR